MKQTNKHNEKTKTFFYFVFFLLTGIIGVGVKPKRHGQLVKPPCNASLENQGAAGMPEKQAKPENSNEKT